MKIDFDYRDTISTIEDTDLSKSDVDTQINHTYKIGRTRDYYRGRSFRYAGKWKPKVHYINDPYITDFVIYDNVLLVCINSHISSESNIPNDFILDSEGNTIGINSIYWDVVISGTNGAFLLKRGGSMEGNINMQNNSIINVSDPVGDKDVSNKQYVNFAVNDKFILLSQSEFDDLVDKDSTKIYLIYKDDSIQQ